MTARATLYTSLPPRLARQIGDTEVGPSYLAECVNSWKRAGFAVVSLNCAREMRQLEPLGYDVVFQEVAADRPQLGDFLRAIRASGKPVAGIINADVILPNHPALLDAVMDHAQGGLVVAERMNIDPLRLRLTWQTCHGFDAFIFRTEPLSRMDPACELSFGEPWWDYWFPLAYLATGARLMTTSVPLIFHLDHAQKWRSAQWIASGNKVVNYTLESAGRLPGDVVAQTRKHAGSAAVSESALVEFSYWCFAWLRGIAELNRISPPDAAPVSTLVALIDNPEVCQLIGKLNEAQAMVVNSKEFGAKALLEGLYDELGDPGVSAGRDRVLAALCREIQNMSLIVQSGKVSSGEDALRAVTEGTRILTSRRANLMHFLALNAAWLHRQFVTVTKALKRRAG
ncbi:MAG TPA: hypothetical protein VK281_18365 [Xanthobacteraceae bacterium]|nr:hypothetical protein [Xanthobacteraceae bacterium]